MEISSGRSWNYERENGIIRSRWSRDYSRKGRASTVITFALYSQQFSNSVKQLFYLRTFLSMLARRGRFITPLSRGSLRAVGLPTHTWVYMYFKLSTLQSLRVWSESLEKGHQRERKLSKGEEAARDRELVLDSAYECTVNVASSSL